LDRAWRDHSTGERVKYSARIERDGEHYANSAAGVFGIPLPTPANTLTWSFSMNPALLLIDIQNDYFPGGAMELHASARAGVQAAKLLQAFRQKSWEVIHIQHVSTRPGASFFIAHTAGVEIHAGVAPLDGEMVFQKNYANSFRETPLLAHLRDRQLGKLVIAGMMTHMCIDTSTRAAADLGFECVLVHDACATKALSFGAATVSAENVHSAFLAALNGPFAKVLSVDEICATL
jgi:nicotinamidase-related amidase